MDRNFIHSSLEQSFHSHGVGSFNEASHFMNLNDGVFNSVMRTIGASNIVHEDQNSFSNASPMLNEQIIPESLFMTSRADQSHLARRLKTQGKPRYIVDMPQRQLTLDKNKFVINGYPCPMSINPPVSSPLSPHLSPLISPMLSPVMSSVRIGTPEDSQEFLLPEPHIIKSKYRLARGQNSVDFVEKRSVKSTKGSSNIFSKYQQGSNKINMNI
jgi:hypothetical protein